MDILTAESFRQFSLLIQNSFIGKFVNQVGGDVEYLQQAVSITLSKYMLIWCIIQVLLYRFTQFT